MVCLLVLTVNLIQLRISLEESLNEESSGLDEVGLCACLQGILLTDNWCEKTQFFVADGIP